jgi:hypothetical protein
MALSLKHSAFVVVADDGTSPVGSNEWNAEHAFTMDSGYLLGRLSAGAGSVEQTDTPTVSAYRLNSSAINAQTGTTYTLVATDNGKIVTLNNAAAITLTCPSGLGAAFSCMIIQLGAGQVNVVAGGGTTLGSYNTLTHLAGQYAGGTIIAPTADNFVLIGNLA